MKDNYDLETNFKNHSWIVKRLNELRNLIYSEIKDLGVSVFKLSKNEQIDNVEDLFYKPIYEGDNWGEDKEEAWFHITSKLPTSIQNKHIVLIINIGAEGIVYKENVPIASVAPCLETIDNFNASPSNEEIEITKNSKGGELINLYIKATFNGIFDNSLIKRAKFEYAKMCSVNDLYKSFYYDYFSLCCLYTTLDNKQSQDELKDFLDRSYYYAIDGNIENALNTIYGLIKSYGDSSCTIYGTGFSHVDIGGYYCIEESINKVHRTLIEQGNNIQKYNEYKFEMSQPSQIEIIQNINKSLFNDYIKYSDNKSFEMEGVFYTESNLLISSGESIIRQLFYGKKIIKDVFGHNSEVAILPNAYSLPINISQLLLGAGVKYILTAKLCEKGWPYNSFVLKGIDNSEIIIHSLIDNRISSDGTPIEPNFIKNKLSKIEQPKLGLMLYGTKDGVAGPNEIHIECVSRESSLISTASVKQKFISDFFIRLFNYKSLLPIVNNHVSVNYDQASYTLQSYIKCGNRQCEKLLKQIEYLDACYYILHNETREGIIDELWKETLLLQSNKILSGYSISDVNREVLGRYTSLIFKITDLKKELISKLLGEGDNYFNFNSSSLYQYGRMPNGSPYKLLPFEIKQREPIKYPHFYAYDSHSIANGITTIKFNRYGQITSIVTDGKEYIKKKSNIIRIYNKRGNNDYRCFDTKYTKKRSTVLKAHKSTLTFHRNKISKTFFYKNNDVEITQIISLYDGKPGAEFKTLIKENTNNKMIRADFYPSVWNDTCFCKSHFCEYPQSTKVNHNSPELEVCCQGYAYVYDDNNEMGFCVLSDKKYGYRLSNQTISLNLLLIDKHKNEKNHKLKQPFKYQILPMNIDNKDTILETYSSMAYPIETLKGKNALKPLIVSTNNQAVITSIKKANGQDAIICRLYENCGKPLLTSLDVNFDFSAVYESNLIEEIDYSKEYSELLNNIRLNPYQIRTFIFLLKKKR